jgi:hypothetical protein
MPSDELVREETAPPPHGGLYEGLDPALDNQVYRPEWAQDLENVRVGRAAWEVRYGMSLWRTLAGTALVQLLTSTVKKDGSRYRLAVRNGIVYDWDEGDAGGADVAWQAVSGGTGLHTTNRCHGVQLGEAFYFTDQASALKKYTVAAASTVASVTQPAQPAAPTVKPRYYGYLEKWDGGGGAAPFGWTVSSAADFDLEDASTDDPWPGDGNTARIHVKTTSAKNKTITENVAGESVPSNTIAFYFNHTKSDVRCTFQYGQNNSGEFNSRIKPPKANDWLPYFVKIGPIGTISYKRFKCIKDDATWKLNIGPMVLPGKLEGKYRYRVSHYDPTNYRESKLSDPSSVVDLSEIGINYKNETDAAFMKCAAVYWTSDSGTDSTTTKVRIYRQGGVPSLTKDENGRDIWIKVGEVYDQSTTLTANVAASATTCVVASVTNLSVNDWIVITKGSTEDIRRITAINAGTKTLTLDEGVINAHTSGDAVQVIFLDNIANEEVDVTNRAEVERDDPPTGAKWVAKTEDGRLWAFGWTNKPAGVAVSNKPTPERPRDHEVFPDGVDPLTRQDLLQGWRFDIAGEAGEEIMWGGIFAGIPTILTRTGLYQVNAFSQRDWGPSALVKVLQLGCISGDTVAEINGELFWVSDGPQVVRWDGQAAPVVISNLRINQRLKNAPETYWSTWFAVSHRKRDGAYYQLQFVPSGATTATQSLQYNLDLDAWEPVVYYDSLGAAIPLQVAHVQRHGADKRELFAVHPTTGAIYKLDDTSVATDNGVAIKFRLTTKRFPLGAVSKIERVYLHLAGATDSITLQVKTGGGQYSDTTKTYTKSLAGTGDVEVRQRAHFSLRGRWVEFKISGDVSNRPTFRSLVWLFTPYRTGNVSNLQ